MFLKTRAKLALQRREEILLYESAHAEMQAGKRVAGIWAKAIALSDGDDSRIEAIYLRERVKAMKDTMTVFQAVNQERSSRSPVITSANSSNTSRISGPAPRVVETESSKSEVSPDLMPDADEGTSWFSYVIIITVVLVVIALVGQGA